MHTNLMHGQGTCSGQITCPKINRSSVSKDDAEVKRAVVASHTPPQLWSHPVT